MATVLISVDQLGGLSGPHIEILHQAGFEIRHSPRPGFTLSEEETIEALLGISATIAGGEPYTERVLSSLPELRVVSRWGVGFDRIDVEAATRYGVAIAVTPNANHEAVAECTMAMLLATTRFLVKHNKKVRQGLWARFASPPLRGKTLGLIGLGRIGRSVAVRAKAFGTRILAYETFPDKDFLKTQGIELVDLETLLSQSDYVSLHVPLTETTRGLINHRTLSRMKRGSFLINTARGGLVVEEDLAVALQDGRLAGAALDVFAQEPIDKKNPLLKCENVLMTPHLAGIDDQAVNDMSLESAQNIVDLSCGIWPEGSVVNSTLKSTWKW